MNQRDFEALQRDFVPLLSAADFVLLVAEVETAPTSFARCNVIANWRKWTHNAREAQIVEAHAVDGVLYGWSEVVEPVQAVDRMHPTWWANQVLWEYGRNHHSATEHAALLSVLWQANQAGRQSTNDSADDFVGLVREVLVEEWKPLRVRLQERGQTLEEAWRELWAA